MSSERSAHQTEQSRGAVDTVTAAALDLIQPDGTVLFHYEDGEEFLSSPVEAIDPFALPDTFKRQHLHLIANSIITAISDRDLGPPGYQQELLASRFAPYREHQDFVWYGADLVIVGSTGHPFAIAVPKLAELGTPRG